MNERQWLACDDPYKMLQVRLGKVSERKLRLFACASARRALHRMSDRRCRAALEVAERYADGLADKAALQKAREQAAHADVGRCGEDGGRCGYAAMALQGTALTRLTNRGVHAARCAALALDRAGEAALADELRRQCDLIRCLLGSPFRLATVDPSWRTPPVVTLATAAYDKRELPAGTLERERLVVLADALEDAGCDNADILSHLRGPGPHVRGCHVLDAILEK